MSEQIAEPTHGESGVAGAEIPAPPVAASTVAATSSLPEVAGADAPAIAPDHEAPVFEAAAAAMPKAGTPRVEVPRLDASRLDASRIEAPKIEAVKADMPRPTGQLLIMAPGERAWTSADAAAKPEPAAQSATNGKWRFSAIAAVVALAMVTGAIGGAVATAGLSHFTAAAAPGDKGLEGAVARIDAEILALKAGLEQTTKSGMSQFNKTNDRLDKVEKAQAEPAAKLAKLSEAVDRLRAAPAAAVASAAPVAARETTGSVPPPAAAPVAATPPKPEVARLPTVEGWVLADVGYGSALIESRRGSYEVFAGDSIPGLGRIDAIRKQDGRWVVVTSKGLITSR